MRTQLAYLLARQQISLPPDLLSKLEEEQSPLYPILNNAGLSANYKSFVTTLSLLEPKSLEEIYKSHLDDTAGASSAVGAGVDSARQNLASTFVNAFVNVGCANDKLMVAAEEGQSWIYKNKEHGQWQLSSDFSLI